MKHLLSCCLTLCCLASAGEVQRTTFPAESLVGECRWRSGYLVSFGGRDNRDSIALFSGRGELLFRTKVDIPDTYEVRLTDASVAADGSVAAIVATHGETYFVSVLDLSGKQKGLFPTGQFLPRRIAVSSDAVWVLGMKRTSEKAGGSHPSDDYGIVVKYAFDGSRLGEFLPRSSFRGWDDPTRHVGDPDLISRRGPKGIDTGYWPQTFIVMGLGRVGICITATREWIELAPSGELIGRWSYADLGHGGAWRNFLGIALTASGDVYAAMTGTNASRVMDSYAIFKLDRERSSWRIAAGSMTEYPREFEHFGALLGAEEGSLVFERTHDAPEIIHWPLP